MERKKEKQRQRGRRGPRYRLFPSQSRLPSKLGFCTLHDFIAVSLRAALVRFHIHAIAPEICQLSRLQGRRVSGISLGAEPKKEDDEKGHDSRVGDHDVRPRGSLVRRAGKRGGARRGGWHNGNAGRGFSLSLSLFSLSSLLWRVSSPSGNRILICFPDTRRMWRQSSSSANIRSAIPTGT